MKSLSLLLSLSVAFTAGAQTVKQDSAHRAYHMLHKKDPKQNNPYAFADSAKAKSSGKAEEKSTLNGIPSRPNGRLFYYIRLRAWNKVSFNRFFDTNGIIMRKRNY